jgi:hypothetical protein
MPCRKNCLRTAGSTCNRATSGSVGSTSTILLTKDGWSCRDEHRDVSAHRVADQGHRPATEALQETPQHCRVGRDGRAAAGRRRAPEAGQVHGHGIDVGLEE